MGADFSGYATKAGLKCSDGRTIMPHAFKAQDGMKVPLVWQHGHNDPDNVLGHAVLENREDGVYAYGYFNNNARALSAKTLVQHQDIVSMSIYANRLVEKSKQVFHGVIREVSLVLSGANPGALIDNVTMSHADGSIEALEDEAVIYTGLVLEHEDLSEDDKDESTEETSEESTEETSEESTEETSEETDTVEHQDNENYVRTVYDGFTEDQKRVIDLIVGAAIQQAAATHSDSDEDSLEHKEGQTEMGRNVFEQTDGAGEGTGTKPVSLTHSDIQEIVADAQRIGSLKAAVESYALKHGIDDIDILFPDAKTIADRPEFDKRRTEWVAGVLNGTKHTPFSRIKTLSADLTHDEARAKGYIKGSMKKEEFFGVAKRVTTPTTIYKKQKLDRDDIIDITDFDVVSWLKGEMRLMLEEELARAILIGDGRDVADEDKINESNIRPISKEHELYATTVYFQDDMTGPEIVDRVLENRVHFKGTGTPVFYTKESVLTKMLLTRDAQGHRLYKSVDDLASELRVSSVVPVEVMEDEADLLGVIVNLQDYVVGADRGGEVSMFDDFDIDYNQYKYLIETRVSGALTKIKAALVLRTVDAAVVTLADPTKPSFNPLTGVVTIPASTNYEYQDASDDSTLTPGAQDALSAGESITVVAVADTGYSFASSSNDEWTFFRRS